MKLNAHLSTKAVLNLVLSFPQTAEQPKDITGPSHWIFTGMPLSLHALSYKTCEVYFIKKEFLWFRMKAFGS